MEDHIFKYKPGMPRASRKMFLTDDETDDLVGKIFIDYKNQQDLLIVHHWSKDVFIDNKMNNTPAGIPIEYKGKDGHRYSSIQAACAVDVDCNYYEIQPILMWNYISKPIHDTNEEIFNSIEQQKSRYAALKELYDSDPDDEMFPSIIGNYFKPTITGFDINLIDEEYDYYHPHRWDQSTHDYMIPILLSYCVCYRDFPATLATYFNDDYDKINSLISSIFDPIDIRDYL